MNAKQLFAVDKDQDSKVVSRQLAEIVYPLLFALVNFLHSFSSVELNYQERFKASKKIGKIMTGSDAHLFQILRYPL